MDHSHLLYERLNQPSTKKRSNEEMGLKNTVCGEIVEVQGGHIMRSIGRKDRHSKVCTAKGPRDRRVRLAAHTAIQFYDVQDRLGYDRPSKVVDWLIKKAKAAIDEKATSLVQEQEDDEAKKKPEEEDQNQYERLNPADLDVSGKRAATAILGCRGTLNDLGGGGQDSTFLPPPLDSDSIADTIKSFFPTGASAESSSSSSMQFQRFTIHELLSRTSSRSQDLSLSLQSLQDPILLQQHQAHQNHPTTSPVVLSGTPISFDAATLWPDHHHHKNNTSVELNRFQKLQSWNVGGGENASEGSRLYNPTQSVVSQHSLHHNTQRGPLQSSNTPSIRTWMDNYPAGIGLASADYINNNQQGHNHDPGLNVMAMCPSSVSGIGYHQLGISGLAGFHVPARARGVEEEHGGYSDQPSSASSDSHH